MNLRQLLIGTIVGGVVLFLVGYVLFDLVAGEFYAANVNPAPGLMRDTQELWAIGLGSLALGLLITLGMLSKGTPPTMMNGLVTGAVFAFLAWLSADFTLYGYLDFSSLTLVIVDPILEIIHGGITGIIIAAVLSQVPSNAKS